MAATLAGVQVLHMCKCVPPNIELSSTVILDLPAQVPVQEGTVLQYWFPVPGILLQAEDTNCVKYSLLLCRSTRPEVCLKLCIQTKWW